MAVERPHQVIIAIVIGVIGDSFRSEAEQSARLIVRACSIAFVLFSIDVSNGEEADRVGVKYSVVKAEFGKPPVWFELSKDARRYRPLDVLRRFLRCFQTGDKRGAQIECQETELDGLQRTSLLREGKFGDFSAAINQASIESVNVSVYAIRGKSGYWAIKCKCRYRDGGEEAGSFDYKEFEGRWKIVEKPHWLSIAVGEFAGRIRW